MSVSKFSLLLLLITLSTAQISDTSTQSCIQTCTCREREQPHLDLYEILTTFNPSFSLANINKIKILIKILRTINDLNVDFPSFLKNFIKQVPLSKLKELLEWFEENDEK